MPVNGPSFDSVSASLVSAVSEHSASERGRRGLRGAGERARLCTPLHERRGSSPARHGDIASRNFTQLRGDFTPTSRNFTCAREARASENFRLIKPITIIFIVSPALADSAPRRVLRDLASEVRLSGRAEFRRPDRLGGRGGAFALRLRRRPQWSCVHRHSPVYPKKWYMVYGFTTRTLYHF
jgi:hypothetical protein